MTLQESEVAVHCEQPLTGNPQHTRLYKRAAPKSRSFGGRCYVYLLVHGHEERFKIGLSQTPIARASNLPEAPYIDWSGSMQVVFANSNRASQVERMLHKALADFRLDFKSEQRLKWDGYTEWFSQNGFRHAINLLRVTPKAGDLLSLASDVLPVHKVMLDADNRRWLQTRLAADYKHARELFKQRQQRATDFNLSQLAKVAELLTFLSWSLRIEVTKMRTHPTQIPAMLRVHGLKDARCEAVMTARLRLLDSERWVLRSGHATTTSQVVPLVTLIRYTPTSPHVLELLINDSKLIEKLPGGRLVLAQWEALCQRLT